VAVGPADKPLTQIYGLAGGAATGIEPAAMDWSTRTPDGSSVVPIAGTTPAPGPPAGVAGLVDWAILGRLAAIPNMSYATTGWAIGGQLADGTTVLVGSVNAGGTDRLVSLVGPVTAGGTDRRVSRVDAGYADHGLLDAAAPLPIGVRLPGGRGWVAAAPRAALRHRAPGQAWRAGGFEAVLVPDPGPVEIEVRRSNRPAAIVRLG
jgi:hypothetical protein